VSASDSSPSFPIGSASLSTHGPFGDHDVMSGISASTVRIIPAVGNAHGMVEGIKGAERMVSQRFLLYRLTSTWAAGPGWNVTGRWPSKAMVLRGQKMASFAASPTEIDEDPKFQLQVAAIRNTNRNDIESDSKLSHHSHSIPMPRAPLSESLRLSAAWRASPAALAVPSPIPRPTGGTYSFNSRKRPKPTKPAPYPTP